MSNEKLTPDDQEARARHEAWAAAVVSALLSRVYKVCITEYQWLIDELLRRE